MLALTLLGGCASTPPPPVDLRLITSPEDRRISAREAFVHALSLEMRGQPQVALDAWEVARYFDDSDPWLSVSYARRLRQFRRSDRALELLLPLRDSVGILDADAWELIAGLWLDQGREDSAAVAWETVLTFDPTSHEALLGLSLLAENRGDWAEAARRLGALAATSDARPLIGLRATESWRRANKPDSALASARRLWVSSRASEHGQDLALQLALGGQFEEALDTLALLPKPNLEPKSAPVLELVRSLASRRDTTLPEVSVLATALTRHPTDETLETLASLLWTSNANAAGRIERILSLNPGSEASLEILRGLSARNRGKSDSARLHLERATSIAPWRRRAWILLGLQELSIGRAQDGVRSLSICAERFPKHAPCHTLLGLALVQQARDSLRSGDWTDPPPDAEPLASALRRRALHAFEAALALDSTERDASFERAAVQERLHKFADAVQSFRNHLKRFPDDHRAANYLGYILADRDTLLDEADLLLERALSLSPGQAAYLDSRGWLRFRQGRFTEALADIEEAAAKEPGDPIILLHRARVLEALGRTDSAVQAFHDAQEAARQADLRRRPQPPLPEDEP